MASYTVGNFMGDTICRICLQSSDSMHPVFDSIVPNFDAPPVAVLELWRLLRDILISKVEIFPDSMCLTCYADIQNLYIFLLKCENAEVILKQAKQMNYTQPKLKNTKSNLNQQLPPTPENFIIAHLNDSYKNFDIENEEDLGLVCLDSFFNNNEGHTSNYERKSNIETLPIIEIDLLVDDTFKCSKCSYSCLKKENLQDHINRDHTKKYRKNSVNCPFNGSKKLDCDSCVKAELNIIDFDFISLTNRNQSTNTTKSIPTTSESNEEDKLHMQSYHFTKHKNCDGKTMKAWNCGLCTRNFENRCKLKRHLSTHTNVRNYVCNKCGKAFRKLSTLSQHCATHSKERPYACEKCNKFFNRISRLITHRKIHSDVKSFQCRSKSVNARKKASKLVIDKTNSFKCDSTSFK